jgi:hypothetical protein
MEGMERVKGKIAGLFSPKPKRKYTLHYPPLSTDPPLLTFYLTPQSGTEAWIAWSIPLLLSYPISLGRNGGTRLP